MDAKIAGFIEESHYDEGGRRVVDKFQIEHISLVPEDEMKDVMEFSGNGKGVKNTDVEIWRKVPDDYYSPSIRVTEQGDIGIRAGGHVLVASVERWFAAGKAAFCVKDELSAWDELSDEALENFEGLLARNQIAQSPLFESDEVVALKDFEKLVDESVPPMFWIESQCWAHDDWLDWLSGR